MWEEFKFLPVRAKYFQLKLMTNYGSKSFALSQVQFSMKTGSACTDVSHSSGDHTQSWNYQKVPVTASIYDARKKTMQSHLEATITKSQNCNTTTVTCDGHQDMFHVALTGTRACIHRGLYLHAGAVWCLAAHAYAAVYGAPIAFHTRNLMQADLHKEA